MALLEEPIKEVRTLKNYIDGEWVESKGEVVDVVNPATYKTISKVVFGSTSRALIVLPLTLSSKAATCLSFQIRE